MRPRMILLLVVCVLGCTSQTSSPITSRRAMIGMFGQLTTPEIARVDVDDTLSKFDANNRDVLFRYLAGNERWEIRNDRSQKYAVRRELVDGSLKTTLNGFYSASRAGKTHQTRVIITFGRENGFGVERGQVTRTRPGTPKVPVIVESEHSGTPGNTSRLIVNGPAVGLEVYDQAPSIERTFTQDVLRDVGKELTAVLRHQGEVRSTGVMPEPEYYPRAFPKEPSFDIHGFEGGRGELSAFVNPKTAGYVEARIVKTWNGKKLPVEDRSQRYVGWSEDGSRYFPYNAELSVYEQGWFGSAYEARFELWHVSDGGTETKLAEQTKSIRGWER